MVFVVVGSDGGGVVFVNVVVVVVDHFSLVRNTLPGL